MERCEEVKAVKITLEEVSAVVHGRKCATPCYESRHKTRQSLVNGDGLTGVEKPSSVRIAQKRICQQSATQTLEGPYVRVLESAIGESGDAYGCEKGMRAR